MAHGFFALMFIGYRRCAMLVLTRRCGEHLVIDNDIVVTIVAIEGNKIRLGIQAPPSIRVDRAEIHARRLADEAAAKNHEKLVKV
jgi:carbon storage regulator